MFTRPGWWLDVLRLYWPLNRLGVKMMRLPVFGRLVSFILLPLITKNNFHVSYLPINAHVEPPASSALPRQILENLIRRSAHRIIIRRCSCRDSRQCRTYPVEDSCLLLGEDTKVVDSRIARHVSVNEALDHAEAKIASGLIPLVGRVRMDDFYYGIPNRGRMLTVCFCCPCCCSVLGAVRYLPPEAKASIVRLQSVAVSVDPDKCRQCLLCVDACLPGAVSFTDGSIRHEDGKCIGCGRCATVCAHQATTLTLENIDAAIDEMLGRMNQRVNIE